MKRTISLLIPVMILLAAQSTKVTAKVSQRMLEKGKMWMYIHHHFESEGSDNNHSTSFVHYVIDGDTVIDNRQYMKMYRTQNGRTNYFGAFREDQQGRVYARGTYYGNDKETDDDLLLIDFTLQGYGSDYENVSVITNNIKVPNQLMTRYTYKNTNPDGTTYNMGFIGIEGVGFSNYGLVRYLLEPQADCICDYEEFYALIDGSIVVPNSFFSAPTYISLTNEERDMVTSNNDFAFNLMRNVKLDGNLVLSPLSITYALGMINNGAAGQTQQEINTVLGCEGISSPDAINNFCRKMLAPSGLPYEETTALISNAIFVNHGLSFQLQEPFAKTVNEYYDAMVSSRDFADGKTLDVINQWASDNTNGMIPKVLDDLSFNPHAASYLLNAICFKGIWTDKFDPGETKEEPFGYSDKTVQMMHKVDVQNYYTENDLYQALKLSYGNEAYAMTILLPREGKTVEDVLAQMNAGNWQVNKTERELMLENYLIDLKLPRFETTTDMDLIPLLERMGLRAAFSREMAEFPLFCTPGPGFFIELMRQNAKIKLDEEGTEAAAVTTIGVTPTSAQPELSKVLFHANRPFVYIINEQSTGAIFFIGKYLGKEAAMGSPDPSGIDISCCSSSAFKRVLLHNLQGQQLSEPPAHGLYIENGKLFMRPQRPSRR